MNRHSLLWRAPGRRDQERKRFAALMRRVEARRLKLGLSKAELAAELGTTDDADEVAAQMASIPKNRSILPRTAEPR